MALSTATITFDIADMLGVDFDARRTKVWVTTNVPDETVVDTVGNKIRLGSGNVTINTDGTGSAVIWVPGTGGNPASWQTYFHVDYPDRNSSKGRATRDFGPFTITTGADLADLILEQEVPPTYLSQVTTLLDTYVTEAEAARDGAVAIVGPVDGVVEALVKNTGGVGPLTSAALAATFAVLGTAVTPQEFFQAGDPDWTLAFGRMFASGATSAFVPAGIYGVTATLTQPATMDVQLEPGAIIRATAAIAGPLWRTATGAQVVRKSLHGGTFDCNGLAQDGINLYWVGHFSLADVTVLAPTRHFIIVGDTAAGGSSYEAEIHNTNCYRAALVAGSYGIWLNKGNDHRVTGATIVNADTGIRAEVSGDNVSTDVHVWSYPTGGSIGFDDNGSNRWVSCQVDDPGLYGYRLRQSGSILIAPQVYLSDITPDNIVTGIYADGGATYTANACAFVAASPIHRFAGDVNAISTLSVARSVNVAVTLAAVGKQFVGGDIVSETGALVLGASAGTDRLRLSAAAGAQYIQSDDDVHFTAIASGTQRVSVSTAGTVTGGAFTALAARGSGTITGVSLVVGAGAGATLRLTGDSATQYIQHDDLLAFTAVSSGTVRAKIGIDGGISPGWNGAVGGAIYSGSGVPSNALGANGDSYFRTDTPSTANQRLYVRSAGAWVGIL